MLYLKDEIILAVKKSVIISERALQVYIKKSKCSADCFGTMLIRDGILSRGYMGRIISDSFNVSYVELSSTLFYLNIFELIPTELFLNFNVIPLYAIADTVTLVSSDPLNNDLKKKLSNLLRSEVNMVYSFSDEIIFYLYKINNELLLNNEAVNMTIKSSNNFYIEKDQLMHKLANYLIKR